MNLIYQNPFCRIDSYLIGLLCGYLVNEDKKIKKLDKTIYLLIGDLICFLILVSTVFIYSNNWSYIECSFYFSLSRQIWSFCICWIIISCYLRPNKLLNRLLSLKALVVLSRLSYSVYLIHPIMLTFYFCTQTQPITIYHSSILFYAFVTTIFSFVFSFVINLIVEIPVSNLNFLKSKSNSSKGNRNLKN